MHAAAGIVVVLLLNSLSAQAQESKLVLKFAPIKPEHAISSAPIVFDRNNAPRSRYLSGPEFVLDIAGFHPRLGIDLSRQLIKNAFTPNGYRYGIATRSMACSGKHFVGRSTEFVDRIALERSSDNETEEILLKFGSPLGQPEGPLRIQRTIMYANPIPFASVVKLEALLIKRYGRPHRKSLSEGSIAPSSLSWMDTGKSVTLVAEFQRLPATLCHDIGGFQRRLRCAGAA